MFGRHEGVDSSYGSGEIIPNWNTDLVFREPPFIAGMLYPMYQLQQIFAIISIVHVLFKQDLYILM